MVPRDAYVRTALSLEQQEQYLQFFMEYGVGSYYDDVVVLLETGLRVSELYGLAKNGLDFDRRCIHVRRQLSRTANPPYFVSSPKPKSGIRTIPMTDTVYMALKRVLKSRASPKVEMLVDGCAGFIFLDKARKPKAAMHLENFMRGLQRKHPWALSGDFPKVTSHVMRHTFRTNMQQAGIDIKSLQHLTGHSNASVTLDVYTHTDYSVVKRAFGQVAASL